MEFAPYIIMPEELLYMLQGKDGDGLILDIRSRESYSRGHIKGAVFYDWPPDEPDSPVTDGVLSFVRDIIIIDEDGEKSFELLRYLLVRGYSRVQVIEGGMRNWPYGDHLETEKDLP